jgi:peptidoglycan/LPS O-acetylase OafA/YrhL
MGTNSIEITYHKNDKIKSLDGLRGLAIILVLLFHNFLFLKIANIGWIGVDLFFALSGFLITRILLNTKANPHYYKNFFIRRMLRIFPLYYVISISCILFGYFIYAPLITPITTNAAYYLTYTQNILFTLNNDFVPKTIINHFWSLCVEEHFYLIWPFIIYYLSPKKILIVSSILIILSKVISVCMVAYDLTYVPVYVFSLTRFDSLLSGSLIAVICLHWKYILEKYLIRSIISISFIMLVFYGYTFIKHNGSFAALNPENAIMDSYSLIILLNSLLFSCMIAFALYDNKFSRFVSNKIFTQLGKYSYGIYVYHLPIYLLLGPILKDIISTTVHSKTIGSISSSFILTALACTVSIISYNLFEKKFMALKDIIAKY